MEPSVAESPDACKRWATQIRGDKERLLALGRHLEVSGSYRSAIAVYNVSRNHHPNDKNLLKRFVRAQAELRGQKLLAGLTVRKSPVTPIDRPLPKEVINQPAVDSSTNRQSQNIGSAECWQSRWVDALTACQRDIERSPENGVLHERLADVYRSLGQPTKALHHYQKSTELIPVSDSARRKHRALSVLVGGQPAVGQAAASAFSKSPARPSQTPQQVIAINDRLSVVQQLELLDDLRSRKLINSEEYRQRRAQVLEQAFNKSVRAEKTVLANADIPRPESVYRSAAKGIATGRYYALVIGNNRYRHFPALQTAVSDASAISELLKNRYGFSVKTLINTSRYELIKALSKLRSELTEKDNLLIYYAGHGVIDEATRRGYWLPVEAEQDNVANWISAGDITDSLSGVAAKHAIVVADSCYSGSLLRSVGQIDLDQREALLKRLSGKRSRTVLTSGGLEPVLDDGDGEHSVFARAFIDILAENNDLLEAGRLFTKLRERVILNADQTPQYAPIRNAGHDGGDFIFAPI